MGLFCRLPDTDQQHLCYESGNLWKSLLPKNDNTNFNSYYWAVSIHDSVCNIYWVLALFLVSRDSGSTYHNDPYSATDSTPDGGFRVGDGNADFFLGHEVPRLNLCDDLRGSDLDVPHTCSLSPDPGSRALP